MLKRQFDGKRVRAVRRAAELHQAELAKAVGVSASLVARWEKGSEFPKGEKLPTIAAALGQALDDLFPYEGSLPDLHLLRCDAGLSVAEAADALGTSRVPVNYAEAGRRRLSDAYVGKLAQAYGVTEEELLAAQDMSFGISPASARDEQASVPRALGEKVTFLLEHGYEEQEAPSNEEIAQVVNDHAREEVVTADGIAALRAGTVTDVPDVVRAGLAKALRVDDALLQDGSEVSPAAREFMAALEFFKGIRRGQILGLAARGNHEGLSAEMMDSINRVVRELKHKLPGAPDDGQ